jgi:hypothetical protein
MAESAEMRLKEAGAAVTLAKYDGGHGWTGDTFADVKAGIEWLEKNVAKKK